MSLPLHFVTRATLAYIQRRAGHPLVIQPAERLVCPHLQAGGLISAWYAWLEFVRSKPSRRSVDRMGPHARVVPDYAHVPRSPSQRARRPRAQHLVAMTIVTPDTCGACYVHAQNVQSISCATNAPATMPCLHELRILFSAEVQYSAGRFGIEYCLIAAKK